MSNKLFDLQQDFQHYLLDKDNSIIQYVVNMESICAITRLNIYKDAYVLRLLESLEHDYPVLAQLMGEEQFTKIGQAYIGKHPSIYRSIRWFGQNFSAFIRNDHAPFWAEMAAFEWALVTAFDAANSVTVDTTNMQAIAPELWTRLQFKMHSSLQLLDLSWNVIPIWKSIRAGRKKYARIKQYARPITWMVWRQGLETYFHPLKPSESWALYAAQSGQFLGEICEGLSQWASQEQVVLYIATLLKSWVHRGLIEAIEIH